MMTGRNLLAGVVAVFLAVLVVTAVQARSYQCEDNNGVARFQDRPCEIDVDDTVSKGKHFLWQANAGKGTLYLLGSIHFGTREMYPLPWVMTSRFKQSNALVVEADILNTDPLEMVQLLASKSVYKDGSTLRQHVSAETWQNLEQVATSLGVPIALLNMQKPWFVSISLTALALNRMGFSEDLGIDAHFLGLARDKKKIIELESLAWQLALFEQLTLDEQVAMLEESLQEIEEGKEFFERMLGYWQSGNAEGIQSLFAEGMVDGQAGERLNQLIILDRNKAMADKLMRMAEAGGQYFVVVGAGHLPGPEGIIALLKQQGYQVSQL